MEQLNITVNGKDYELQIKPSANLLDVIREDLGLTGTKEGCGVGECGSCTVIVDGITVNACLMLAMEAQGSRVTTIEGLADGEKLHPIQQAFVDVGGLQCGFCTPGMILSTKALLDENDSPTDEEIRKGLEGNFCRCTGYTKIIESVRTAANMLKGGGKDMEEYAVIGKRVPRIDSREKVMGQAKYAADYSLPGMLWCKIARSPFAHARILNIDTGKAERLPGVKAVITGKDFGGWTWGFMATTRDESPLASIRSGTSMKALRQWPRRTRQQPKRPVN